MSSTPIARVRRGFTLVELLVVIGIIAALIAMLMPVLRKARDAATTAACSSNLHQIGIFISMYTLDGNGFIPHPFNRDVAKGTNPGVLIHYGIFMGDVLPAGDSLWNANWAEALAATNIVNLNDYHGNYYWGEHNAMSGRPDEKVFSCPAWGSSRYDLPGQPTGGTAPGIWNGYGMNAEIFYSNDLDSTGISATNTIKSDGRRWQRLSNLKPDHIFMADGNDGGGRLGMVGAGKAGRQFDSTGANIHLRHRNGTAANYLFPDMHVETSDAYGKCKYELADSPGDPMVYTRTSPGCPWWQPAPFPPR